MEGEQQTAPVTSAPKKNKLGLIIGIVLILIILGGGVYYVFGRNSSTGGGGLLSGVTSKALNPNCKYNDPDLCKFMNNWKEVKYVTMSSTDTSKGGKVTTSVFKMEGDDNNQITISENSKESYNTITIGKTAYTKDLTDNKWWKYTPTTTDSNISSTESEIDFDKSLDSVEDKTTYEKVGTETCGKFTCFKYKEVDPANTEYTQYLYFDNKEYQLRKTRTEMKDGSVSEGTYDYSKFTLSAPSPVKEGNPYDVTTGASTTTLPTTTTPATTIPSTSSSSSSSSSTTTDTATETPAASELPVSDYNVTE